jgi:molybdopterin biosynthesis enzyme
MVPGVLLAHCEVLTVRVHRLWVIKVISIVNELIKEPQTQTAQNIMLASDAPPLIRDYIHRTIVKV